MKCQLHLVIKTNEEILFKKTEVNTSLKPIKQRFNNLQLNTYASMLPT